MWDTSGAQNNCPDVARFRAPFTNGIKNVAFSHDGELLVATGLDDDHSIAVFRWKEVALPQANNEHGQRQEPTDEEKEPLIAAGKGPASNIWSIGFNAKNSQIIATCSNEVNFYSFKDGSLSLLDQGERTRPLGAVLCQAIAEDTLYTGTHDGKIIEWSE